MKLLVVLFLLIAIGILPFGQGNGAEQPFTLYISTDNPVVESGGTIRIKIHVTNTSDKALSMGGGMDPDTGELMDYLYEIRGVDGKLLPKKVFKHAEKVAKQASEKWSPETVNAFFVGRSLKPGESIDQESTPQRAYEMAAPDMYHIQLLRGIPGDKTGAKVRSNTLTITVTP